jgi:hypothetical protein
MQVCKRKEEKFFAEAAAWAYKQARGICLAGEIHDIVVDKPNGASIMLANGGKCQQSGDWIQVGGMVVGVRRWS